MTILSPDLVLTLIAPTLSVALIVGIAYVLSPPLEALQRWVWRRRGYHG